MLAGAIALRVWSPSPFAPRVHVRWVPGLSQDQRASLEQRFALAKGEPRDDQTWGYDLTDPSTERVGALVGDPRVADTHYIERGTARIAADAPAGTVRLGDRPLTTVVHSFVFDWFLFFCASSIIVSSVWLASDADARD